MLHPGDPALLALELPSTSAAAGQQQRPDWDAAEWVAVDAVQPPAAASRKLPAEAATAAPPWHRYCWRKAFHVSPFMPMNQVYDWIFSEPAARISVFSRNLQLPGGHPLVAGDALASEKSSGMCPALPRFRPPQLDDGPCIFSTSVQLDRVPGAVTRLTLLWMVLVAFPLLTQRLQLWIHVEAFKLWKKGVQLHPHPTGATNAFTRAVGALAEGVIIPLFALLALLFTRGETKSAARQPLVAAEPRAGGTEAPHPASSPAASGRSSARRRSVSRRK